MRSAAERELCLVGGSHGVVSDYLEAAIEWPLLVHGSHGEYRQRSPVRSREVQWKCSRLADVPATITAESGTESRSALIDNAPPRRLSNEHAVNITGNPDIRVPEIVEIDDGLGQRAEGKGKDADRDAKTRSERPEAVKGNQNAREARRTDAQAQSATERESEGREFGHVPGGTWLNQPAGLADVPATITAESGTESRFALIDNTPPGRLSNEHGVNITGNPDIRVPEIVEIDDGLGARAEGKGKDADRDTKARSERPEAVKINRNAREARRTDAQAQSATERESERREFRHVPGGTWLNQLAADPHWHPWALPILIAIAGLIVITVVHVASAATGQASPVVACVALLQPSERRWSLAGDASPLGSYNKPVDMSVLDLLDAIQSLRASPLV
ncbi:hypothetical protein NDU88_005641 [Pleurodeles waltl]|uniref:Uncharacterized protein n=1 Tax=Pleurodeles waltl TaxID=8319 RepID=A0AAV7QFB1_PLEWA|nr:hypothetical protein NDU88_005641 [Pleurodeles waltl]